MRAKSNSDLATTPLVDEDREGRRNLSRGHSSDSIKNGPYNQLMVEKWFMYTASAAAVLLSALFLSLAIAIISLDGEIVAELNPRKAPVVELSRLAPTLWPIAFAAVIGGAVKALADRKVENGVELGILEQLYASRTPGGTVLSTVRFRFIDFWTAGLLAVWAFSPLCSQAYLRSYRTQDTVAFRNGIVEIPNFETEYLGSELMRNRPSYRGGLVQSVFNEELMSSAAAYQYQGNRNGSAEADQKDVYSTGPELGGRESCLDFFGNIRVPRPDELQPANDGSDGWKSIPEQGHLDFMSLTGVPANFDNVRGKFSYSFISEFVEVADCTVWEKFRDHEARRWIVDYFESLTYLFRTSFVPNYARDEIPTSEDITNLFPVYFEGFIIDLLTDKSGQQPMSDQPRGSRIVFAANGETDRGTFVYSTNCGVSSVLVETEAECSASETITRERGNPSCLPIRVRRVEDEKYADRRSRTIFNGNEKSKDWVPQEFIDRFSTSSSSQKDGGFTHDYISLTSYLNYPGYLKTAAVEGNTNATSEISENTPLDLFSRRLSLLLNTFWRATIHPGVVRGDFSFKTQHENDRSANITTYGHINNITTRGEYESEPIYQLNWGWVIILFAGNAVMTASALFAFIMRFRAKAPDILGFINTTIRFSKELSEATEGINSTMDGADVAKRLRRLKVRLADVQGDSDVGRIGIAKPEHTHVLEKNRWYE